MTPGPRWPPRIGRALRRVLTNNLGLKLVALVAAIALFSIGRGAEDAQRSIFVDVVAFLPPPSSGKMLVSELPDRVKVTIRGSRSVVNAIEEEDIDKVQVDLTDTSRSYYYFDPDAIDLPAGVVLVQLAPASIPLTWAERVERRVAVEPRLEGPARPGLVARPTSVEPAVVQVEGPEFAVESLVTIETEAIDVAGLAEGTHVQEVPLERLPPHTRPETRAVMVTLEVAPRQAERQFDDVKVEVEGASPVSLRPPDVNLTVWGPEAALAGLSADAVVPFVEVSEMSEETLGVETEVQVRGLPAGVEARVIPSTVVVKPLPKPTL